MWNVLFDLSFCALTYGQWWGWWPKNKHRKRLKPDDRNKIESWTSRVTKVHSFAKLPWSYDTWLVTWWLIGLGKLLYNTSLYMTRRYSMTFDTWRLSRHYVRCVDTILPHSSSFEVGDLPSPCCGHDYWPLSLVSKLYVTVFAIADTARHARQRDVDMSTLPGYSNYFLTGVCGPRSETPTHI